MTCPVCNRRPAHPDYRPFCSRRCADVDLGRWLTGGYAVPARDDDEPDDDNPPASALEEPPRNLRKEVKKV